MRDIWPSENRSTPDPGYNRGWREGVTAAKRKGDAWKEHVLEIANAIVEDAELDMPTIMEALCLALRHLGRKVPREASAADVAALIIRDLDPKEAIRCEEKSEPLNLFNLEA